MIEDVTFERFLSICEFILLIEESSSADIFSSIEESNVCLSTLLFKGLEASILIVFCSSRLTGLIASMLSPIMHFSRLFWMVSCLASAAITEVVLKAVASSKAGSTFFIVLFIIKPFIFLTAANLESKMIFTKLLVDDGLKNIAEFALSRLSSYEQLIDKVLNVKNC